mmetsp:Transcript_5124/g.32297  ORF Transcript_5124/g.32297 Transcript_5124/m.32297 type:complete len:84 (-) Transcript_5124:126-377(-)
MHAWVDGCKRMCNPCKVTMEELRFGMYLTPKNKDPWSEWEEHERKSNLKTGTSSNPHAMGQPTTNQRIKLSFNNATSDPCGLA